MVTRSPSSVPGTYQDWRTRERLAQAQGVDIKRIKYPTPTRLCIPQANLRSPIGPVLFDSGTLKVGDSLVGPQAWGTANTAVFTPFSIETDIVTLSAVIITVVTSGTTHMDVGIYDPDGVRLVSSGSEVLATGHHRFTIAATQLQEGNYYFAGSCDSVVPKFYLDPGYPDFQMAGAKQMASAFPLPATATLVDLATGGGMVCAALEFLAA